MITIVATIKKTSLNGVKYADIVNDISTNTSAWMDILIIFVMFFDYSSSYI